jgi:hypothetical protein
MRKSTIGKSLTERSIHMKERLTKLLNVKSIVTIILTLVFAYLSIVGTITGQDFMTVFAVVIAFYYGTQAQKDVEKKDT